MVYIKMVIFFSRYLSLVTPFIERKRFEQFLKSNKFRKPNKAEDTENTFTTVFTKLIRHPRQLKNSIKRYYQANDYFIAFLVFHTIVIIHVEIKVLFHYLWIGNDPEWISWTAKVHYSNLTVASEHPVIFNKIFLSVTTLNAIMWFRNLYSLIVSSLETEQNYGGFTTTQLNFAYLASFGHQPIDNPLNLLFCIYDFIKHKRYKISLIRPNMNFELSSHQILIQKQLRKDINFQLFSFSHNLIDFNEQHTTLEELWWINRRRNSNKVYYNTLEMSSQKYIGSIGHRGSWYVSHPIHRCDPIHLLLAFVGMTLSMFLAAVLIILSLVAFFFAEIWFGKVSDHNRPDGTPLERLLEFSRTVRFIEYLSIGHSINLLFFTSLNFAWDSMVLSSRVWRTSCIAETELDRLRAKKFRLMRCGQLEADGCFHMDRYAEWFILHVVSLSRVVLIELNDLKINYNSLFNIVIVGYSISISLGLALFAEKMHYIERTVLICYLICSANQILILLVFGSLVEKMVS